MAAGTARAEEKGLCVQTKWRFVQETLIYSMKSSHCSSTGCGEQVSPNILAKEKHTCSPQERPDDASVDHVMADIAHLSTPPRTGSDEALYRILVRLSSPSSTIASQSNAPPHFRNNLIQTGSIVLMN